MHDKYQKIKYLKKSTLIMACDIKKTPDCILVYVEVFRHKLTYIKLTLKGWRLTCVILYKHDKHGKPSLTTVNKW